MRRTLRRSCASCAKAKHKCDLQTPRCSRCVIRKSSCVYANEPLSSGTGQASITANNKTLAIRSRSPKTLDSSLSTLSVAVGARSLDPFNSYPSTGLSTSRVQGLMYHFLSKIAFEYYPLDLNASTNPFIVSWWPLALADPALFNVSLQTASLDDELHAQKGFGDSELLMRDAVSLVRQKVEIPALAFQDATMDAVVTLAAIEYGKGNHQQATMHVNAVKRMAAVRGGIAVIKRTSPLTGRMVPWVAMLVMGSPQFEAQNDLGLGDGVEPTLQWRLDTLTISSQLESKDSWTAELHLDTRNVLDHLRVAFDHTCSEGNFTTQTVLSTDDLHDLTCFVLHRLLSSQSELQSHLSESLRHAMSIYMLIIHGPTYYSHAYFMSNLTLQLRHHLEMLTHPVTLHYSAKLWCLLIGIISSLGTNENEWFLDQAVELSASMGTRDWDAVQTHLSDVLWDEHRSYTIFHAAWEEIISGRSYLLMDAI